MPCSFCGAEKTYAKGLCGNCYQRELRTGKLEYSRKFIKPTDQCSVEECFNSVVAKGLCNKHYVMLKRRGEVVSSFGYGSRHKHPLYGVWDYQKRTKEGRSEAWGDFWQFVTDVGEKPTERHVARRMDVTAPWGVGNFTWRELGASAADAKEYQRNWRKKNPLSAKGISLKKQYGITIQEYLKLYDSQNGECAICGEAKHSFLAGDAGKVHTLVVDHCHERGCIRKLLCASCNKALGGFKDSPALLRRAAEYIESHLTPQQLPDIKPLP